LSKCVHSQTATTPYCEKRVWPKDCAPNRLRKPQSKSLREDKWVWLRKVDLQRDSGVCNSASKVREVNQEKKRSRFVSCGNFTRVFVSLFPSNRFGARIHRAHPPVQFVFDNMSRSGESLAGAGDEPGLPAASAS
jgi:hypothetical protein